MGLFVLFSVLAFFIAPFTPFGLLLMAWAVITVLRTGTMFILGHRPDAAWNHNARIPAALVIPYVASGLIIAALYMMSPAGMVGGISSIILSLFVAGWGASQYLRDEMTCTRGVWHSKEAWMDWTSVDAGTLTRWEAENAAKRTAKEARRAAK